MTSFNIVRDAYVASGYRKGDPTTIPLRIEIDSFLSFVRSDRAAVDSWRAGPLRKPSDQRALVTSSIDEWRETPWPHFEDEIVPENYPRLLRTFGSPDALQRATAEELFDALGTLHSFYDRLRFYSGGIPGWRQVFLAANDVGRVRETLAYLLFGHGDNIVRMAQAIHDPQFKLKAFGQANVQELVGWCNREELPIVNSRTTKVLRYFGSDVRQL